MFLREGGAKNRIRYLSEDIGSTFTTKDSQSSASGRERKMSFQASMDNSIKATGNSYGGMVSVYSEKEDVTIVSDHDDE